MSKDMIYLDYAATTPLCLSAQQALSAGMALTGNPSSVHRAGRAVRAAVDSVRAQLAERLNVGIGQVIFTSGGTEANAIAMSQVDATSRFCSAVEHEAVLSWAPQAHQLPVSQDGVLDLNAAEERLSDVPPCLVSVMLVNNTLGTIQPVSALTQIAKQYGHLVHCDAVQAFGKLEIDVSDLGADFLSVSAHKIGGPKGVGALIVRDGLALKALTQGGGQERRRRPGTENVLGILGFGGALDALDQRLHSFQEIARLSEVVVNALGREAIIGFDGPRVPHIMSLHMPGIQSQLQLMRFDLAGICVSAGSACSSGKVTESHVINALGRDSDTSSESVRVSFGPETTAAEVDMFLHEWDAIRQSVRSAA